MTDLTKNREIADALLAGAYDANLEFRMGNIPEAPVSDYEPLNWLWYSPDAILCHDLEEVIIFANPRARDFFGHDILGKPSIDLVPGYPLELRRERDEAFKRIIKTGIPEHFKDSPRIMDGGRTAPVTGWAFRYYCAGGYSIGAKLLP